MDVTELQQRLDEARGKTGVVGAVVAVLRGDEVTAAASGVLNLATGVEVTTDSVFQIGSISKVWTTTVVQQLADEGRLALDAPIVEVLPELELSDPTVTAKLTMRHLLTHTSGIDGDVFTDFGRGDDCLERSVAALPSVAQTHPLGATFSYSNTGFVLAGRVIEKLTGGTWDAAVRDRIATPLGLTRTGTLPEEALLHRAASGHLPGPAVAPQWMLPRAIGPAGLIHSTAADLLAFARLHLSGGLAPDGTRVLSEQATAEMAAHQVTVPQRALADSWGLGWMRCDFSGHRVIGHDGATIGQSSFVRLLPEQDLAVALLTNVDSEAAGFLYQDLFTQIFAEEAGVTVPPKLVPVEPTPPFDMTPHLGAYERAGVRIEVTGTDGGPRLRMTATGAMADLVPDPTIFDGELRPGPDNLFLARQKLGASWLPVTFYRLPTGEPYVHLGGRATPKI